MSTSLNIPTGNTIWVDSINGNDTANVLGGPNRGDQSRPFLTITAALLVAVSGDTVKVHTGTYTDATLTMVAGVDLIGLQNVILQPTITVTTTFITMADNVEVEGFTINLNPSAGTTTGISFPGTTNATSSLFDIRMVANPTATGVVNLVSDTGTGILAPTDEPTIGTSFFVTLTTAANFGTALTKNGVGQSVYRNSTFDGGGNTGGTGVSTLSTGIIYFYGCKIRGLTGLLQTSNAPIVFSDETTSYSNRNVTVGIFTDEPQFNTVINRVPTVNLIDDSKTAPPPIAGTVSVTNGSATVTGTGTSFASFLTQGMAVQFGNQVGTNYIISTLATVNIAGTVTVTLNSFTIAGAGTSFTTALFVGQLINFGQAQGVPPAVNLNTNYIVAAIASNTSLTLTTAYTGATTAGVTLTATSQTSLTLTTTFTGTTNAATTLIAPKEADSYIVNSPATGSWVSFSKGDLVSYTGTAVGPITGTVAVTNGSATVTGTNTIFQTIFGNNAVIQFGSQLGTNYIISSIASNTSMTLTTNYSGSTTGITTLVPVNTWIRIVPGTGTLPLTGTIAIITGLGQETAAGSFAGKDAQLALWNGAVWLFWNPQPGLSLIVDGANGSGPLAYGNATFAPTTTYNIPLGITSTGWSITAPFRTMFSMTTTTITSAQTTDILIPGMIIVPSAGTYNANFGATFNMSVSGAGNYIYTSAYGGGVEVQGSGRFLEQQNANSYSSNGVSAGLISVNGAQAIEIRWRVPAGGSGTATVYERNFLLQRIR